jgi:hypothetical protein
MAASLEQLEMGALFNNPACLHDEDLIAIHR